MSAIVRAPRWAKAAGAVGLTFALLLGVVSAGIRIPGLSMLFPFRFPASLDYSGPLGSFSPLRSAFVRSVLGDLVPAGRSVTSRSPAVRGASVLGQRLEETHPATNDRRQDARPINSIPYTARTNTRQAGRDADEPGSCAPVGGTVWYRYDADRSAPLIATTFGTRYAVSLGVFASQGSDLRQIGCDSDVGGNAFWPFTAEQGKTYLLQIAGTAGGGDLVFNLEPQGRTSLASANRAGHPGNGPSYVPALSRDGRYVAFTSQATDVAPGVRGDECRSTVPIIEYEVEHEAASRECDQALLRDRRTGRARLVSLSPDGEPGDSDSSSPALSADGRFVAFSSWASNLVQGDTNGEKDVFLYDVRAERTERLSLDSRGAQQDDPSVRVGGAAYPSISADGRYVAFEATFPNLVPGDTNASPDVFVRDRVLGRTTRVSLSSSGTQTQPLADAAYASARGTGPNLTIMSPSISADGRFVAFNSAASNLVAEDSNDVLDVFVHDRVTHRTERVSVSSKGNEGNGDSSIIGRSSISADGRFVAFESVATNLVAGDTNGTGDAFVHDRRTRKTLRVSVSSTGQQSSAQANPTVTGSKLWPTLSIDGTRVAFHSDAPNLVPRDEDAGLDVFVHDLRTRTTIRIDADPSGREPGDAEGGFPWISGDGATIAFDYLPRTNGSLGGVTGEPLEFEQIYTHEMPRP